MIFGQNRKNHGPKKTKIYRKSIELLKSSAKIQKISDIRKFWWYFLSVLFFFYFSLRFFAPSVSYAHHLRWRASSFFLVLRRMASDAAKKAAHFSLPFVCSFRGIVSRLTLSFVAESYSAFYSLYAPLIYVRLYCTSCPVPRWFNWGCVKTIAPPFINNCW